MKRSLIFVALVLPLPAFAQGWELDRASSSITFETEAFGVAVTGTFVEFGAEITLEPGNLLDARIEAWVDMASVQTGARDVDMELTSQAGFASADYPRAAFASDAISRTAACAVEGAVCYVAAGQLSLKGISVPARLSFSLAIQEARAVADGTMTIFRNNFGIGSDEWEAAGLETVIILHLEATRTE